MSIHISERECFQIIKALEIQKMLYNKAGNDDRADKIENLIKTLLKQIPEYRLNYGKTHNNNA